MLPPGARNKGIDRARRIGPQPVNLELSRPDRLLTLYDTLETALVEISREPYSFLAASNMEAVS